MVVSLPQILEIKFDDALSYCELKYMMAIMIYSKDSDKNTLSECLFTLAYRIDFIRSFRY